MMQMRKKELWGKMEREANRIKIKIPQKMLDSSKIGISDDDLKEMQRIERKRSKRRKAEVMTVTFCWCICIFEFASISIELYHLFPHSIYFPP